VAVRSLRRSGVWGRLFGKIERGCMAYVPSRIVRLIICHRSPNPNKGGPLISVEFDRLGMLSFASSFPSRFTLALDLVHAMSDDTSLTHLHTHPYPTS
jgi:hypothetical protein